MSELQRKFFKKQELKGLNKDKGFIKRGKYG